MPSVPSILKDTEVAVTVACRLNAMCLLACLLYELTGYTGLTQSRSELLWCLWLLNKVS